MNRLYPIYFWLGCLWLLPLFAVAQPPAIQVLVMDGGRKVPVSAAMVEDIRTSEFAFTGDDGRCRIHANDQEIHLKISSLGYQVKFLTLPGVLQTDSVFTIFLEASSLALEEVTVTAEKGTGMSTSTTVHRAAMDHTQPASLYDLMQLVPGNLIENPDFSAPQQLRMREVGTEANSAAGAAIILDGNPLLNDANMQISSTTDVTSYVNEVTQNSLLRFRTTAGMGTDLRAISTQNIESIEVMLGIPSVEFGNLTTGAVLVHTKAGYSPLQVRMKTDPFTNQVYVGKGMHLANRGAINVSLDYLTSTSDVLSKRESYDRLNGQVGYFKVFMNATTPLTLNARMNVFTSLDSNHNDPDAFTDEEDVRSSSKGINGSLTGKWWLNKTWITGIKYNISGALSHQYAFQRKYRNSSERAIATSMVPGEHFGVILPTVGLSEFSVDGMPYHFFGQLSAHKAWRLKKGTSNKILAGADYRVSGNRGNGQQFDVEDPPYIKVNAPRPRSYADIPAVHSAAVYIEDHLSLALGSTLLDLEAGVRLNYFRAEDVMNTSLGAYPEPRANVRYRLFSNPAAKIRHFSIRGGAGQLYKAPSLMYLYPNTAYLDLLSLLYYTPNADQRTAVFTTYIFDSKNPHLVPVSNTKFEVGMDFTIGNVKASVTAFREESKNGMGMVPDYHFLNYRRYDAAGVQEDDIRDFAKLPFTNHTYKAMFYKPQNIKSAVKQGVEYTLDLGKISPLYSRFMVDGAWLKTTRIFHTNEFTWPLVDDSQQNEWIAVYPAGDGRLTERLNSTLRMVTHIPKVALVFTTSMQVVWYEKTQFLTHQMIPVYLFKPNETLPFTMDMKDDPEYRFYVHERSPEYFNAETFPPLTMLNFRLTKEIGQWMQLSFYANNFLNYRPTYQYQSTGSFTRRNEPLFFGLDLKFEL